MSFPSPEYQTDDQSQLAYSSDDSGSDSDDAYFLRSESGGSSLPSSPVRPHRQISYGALDRAPYPLSEAVLDDPQLLSVSEPNEISLLAPLKAKPRVMRLNSGRDKRKILRRKQKEQEQREHLVRQLRGKVQPDEWHNTVWLVLFCIQLMAVAFCSFRFGSMDHFTRHRVSSSTMPITQPSNDVPLTTGVDQLFQIDYATVVEIVGFTGIYAALLSTLTVGLMVILARSLIQSSLVFTMVAALAWAIFGQVVEPYGIISILGFSALALTLGFTLWVWERIPFAATNMQTALFAICESSDVLLLGMGALLVTCSWCVVWSMAFVGIVNAMKPLSISDLTSHVSLYLVMLASFCWTNVVIVNVVQVTVASAVGTWWFHPDTAPPCCSLALVQPLRRSLTTSLGSICFGSLVMIPTQVVRTMASLLCLPGDTYFKTCNRWAYTYIGLYGYGFHEAGFRARQLFDTREWASIVNDNLVSTVLWMATIVIGGSTGTFGVLVEEGDGYEFTTYHQPVVTAFLIGSMVGFVLSSILLIGVLDSAVNTVLVCFAAGPFEFQTNHPRLSQEMRDAWGQQVWEPIV